MSTPATPPPATPSAPETPAPVAPAPATLPAAPAPSAPLQTLADFDRYAAEALRANEIQPSPPAAPVVPAVAESPAAPATPATEPVEPSEDAEPSPEVLASLSDAGKRALEAERTKRKTARADLKAAQDQIAELTARLNPPTPAAPSAPETTPALAPATPPSPAVPPNLAECRTFDQVDALTLAAIHAKATANKLMMAMNAGERDEVLAGLRAENMEAIDGTPLDRATDKQLREFIVNTNTGADITLRKAPAREAALRQEALSFEEARALLPGLSDQKSADWKAFVSAVQATPAIRQLGPRWPVLVAQNVAFHLGKTKSATGPLPPPATPPVIPPAPRAAPSAPRTSMAALPRKSETDGLREKLRSGTMTAREMDRLTTLQLLSPPLAAVPG